MSVRLALANLYLSKGTIIKQLLHVEEETNAALDELLAAQVSNYKAPLVDHATKDLNAIRQRMAVGHKQRVRILTQALGKEKATELARRALFEAGTKLGREARASLGVRDESRDLEKAARVMYRVLGIEISLNLQGGKGQMLVHRCALARGYDADTCAVLCATDEGVVNGISDRAKLKFRNYLTSGEKACVAELTFEGGAG